MTQDQRVRFTVLFVPEHEIGVGATLFSLLNEVSDFDVPARVVHHVRNNLVDLLQKVKKLPIRSPVRSHENFRLF